MGQKFEQRQLTKKQTVLLLTLIFALQACGSSDPKGAQDAKEGDAASGGALAVAEQEASDDSAQVDPGPDEGGAPANPDPAPVAPVSHPDLAEACINLALNSAAVDVGGGLPAGYEPSGADWHPRLKKVFSVHDNGFLFMMNKDGSDVTTWNVGGDLEGVTVARPASDMVYIGREHSGQALEYQAAILEYDIEANRVTRTFLLNKNDFPPSQASGLEALTFVEKSGHPEGGVFWVGHQGNGQIYEFELPIVTSAVATTATLRAVYQPVVGRTDLAGMDYSPEFNVVYAAYDASDRLVILDAADAHVYFERALPQNDQEGIAVNDLCDLFIAQDTNKRFWFYKGKDE